jgi:hypothetical protein
MFCSDPLSLDFSVGRAVTQEKTKMALLVSFEVRWLFVILAWFQPTAWASSPQEYTCSQVIDRSRLHKPCSDLKFHNSLSMKDLNQICLSCEQYPCHYDMYNNWKPKSAYVVNTSKSDVITGSTKVDGSWFDKLIPHVYVIHFTEREKRLVYMKKRLEPFGLINEKVTFVSDFDPKAFLPKELECLIDSGHTVPSHYSMNTKHYAAYFDMLRKGHQYALIVEDDAYFKSGSKLTRRHDWVRYDVTSGYFFDNGTKSPGFKATINEIIGPGLPNKQQQPESNWGSQFPFDVLQLGACDHHWNKYRKDVEYAQTFYGSKPYSKHVSVNTCSRCGQAYIVSQQGAVKLLEGIGYSTSPIDVHLDKLWKGHRGGGTTQRLGGEEHHNPAAEDEDSESTLAKASNMKCLWAEPPIVWEDPGNTEDGIRLPPHLRNRTSIQQNSYNSNPRTFVRSSRMNVTNNNIHHESHIEPPPPQTTVIFREEALFFIFVLSNCIVICIYFYRVRR